MNDLYLQLGRAIAGLCPPGFREARLEAAPDEGLYAISCTGPDGSLTEPALDEAARQAMAAPLGEIRAQMAGEEGGGWRSCTVTLTAGGGFAMDVAA